MLIQRGAALHIPGRIRAQIQVLLSPLAIAKRYSFPAIVEQLENAGQQLNWFEQCFFGNREAIQTILDDQPEMVHQEADFEPVWRVTAMHYAAAGKQLNIMTYLQQLGAVTKPYSRLLLNIAARHRSPEMLAILQAGGVDETLIPEWFQFQV